MVKQSYSVERRRGVVLSSQGWQRLQAVEKLSSIRHNQGKPYTLEQLNQMTGLSANTVTKLRRRQEPVDWQTLETYFAAFGLSISNEDVLGQEEVSAGSMLTSLQQAPLKGPLSLDHPFYVCRGDSEVLCADEILKPGGLVRIEAPRQFGKTSLMMHPVTAARDRDFRISIVNMEACSRQILRDPDRFLQWFCAVVAKDLGMSSELSQRWDASLGSNYSCSEYFETYLLPADNVPLLLVIDEIDELLDYPELATDFLGMLRSWYEQKHYNLEQRSIWQQLRLILIYSCKSIPLAAQLTPLNLGLSVHLPVFNWKQVEELTCRYELEPSEKISQTIFSLVGGHPYLTQLCLFHLSQNNISLEGLSENAIAHKSTFSDHLQEQLHHLKKQPSLLESMQAVARHPFGMEIPYQNAFQLQEMGLVQFRGQLVIPSCELYRRYFSQKDERF